MKMILLDTETTGVDINKNDIWQIAGIVINNDKVIDKFDIKFRPPKNTNFSDNALKKIKMRIKDLKSLKKNRAGFDDFLRVLEKHIDKDNPNDRFLICAYYSEFDTKFLRKLFKQHGSIYGKYFYGNTIDIMMLSGEFLKSIRHNMVNFKLQTVYRTFTAIGLLPERDFDKSHDAFFDIQVEYDIYNLLRIENICKTLKKVNKLLNKS